MEKVRAEGAAKDLVGVPRSLDPLTPPPPSPDKFLSSPESFSFYMLKESGLKSPPKGAGRPRKWNFYASRMDTMDVT